VHTGAFLTWHSVCVCASCVSAAPLLCAFGGKTAAPLKSRVHHYFRAGARGGPSPIIAIHSHTHRVFILSVALATTTMATALAAANMRKNRPCCGESYYFQEGLLRARSYFIYLPLCAKHALYICVYGREELAAGFVPYFTAVVMLVAERARRPNQNLILSNKFARRRLQCLDGIANQLRQPEGERERTD
jgi:hypothetical protein